MKILSISPINTKRNNDNFAFKNKTLKSNICIESFSFLDKCLKERLASKRLIQDLKNYISLQKGEIKETDITKIIGYGGFTKVFGLGNDKVIKCSLENPLEHRCHCKEFDIPFLSSVEKVGEHYFVIEPKAETENITIEDCKDVIKRIYAFRL